MYAEEVAKLQKIIDDRQPGLCFSEVRVYLRRVIFRISGVRMDFLSRSISIRRSRS